MRHDQILVYLNVPSLTKLLICCGYYISDGETLNEQKNHNAPVHDLGLQKSGIFSSAICSNRQVTKPCITAIDIRPIGSFKFK